MKCKAEIFLNFPQTFSAWCTQYAARLFSASSG